MSNTCDKCGQDLPEMTNPFNLVKLRNAVGDSNIRWEGLSPGETFQIVSMPANAMVVVVAAETESEWDSYGDPIGNGFVVFSVTYNGETRHYKVQGSKSSYDGWDWGESYLTQVSETPKVVTVWESI